MTKLITYAKNATALLLCMLLFQKDAHALALSDIMLNSHINQPINATIELLSATPAELDSLNVFLTKTRDPTADQTVVSQLKVELVRPEKGNSYLMISSKDNIREPVLNFILEMSWSSGHIQREYSLLLNLPH